VEFDWLRLCSAEETANCIPSIQLAYLAALVVGTILFAVIAVRSRDLSTGALVLITVAIAVNISVGSVTYVLRLPVYLDSVGTVLVGALAGPWAGALTGLLANLIWSILPVPGGAGPTAAFFAPVAAVIGLMAGFWASRGVFRLRTDDSRVGQFLALAGGIAASGVALLIVQNTIGMPELFPEDRDLAIANQSRFVASGIGIAAIGLVVAWLTGRSIFRFGPEDARIRPYLSGATGISAFILVFAIVRLLFAPAGYFSTVTGLNADGTADDFLGGADLTGLTLLDPLGLIVAAGLSLLAGVAAWAWAKRGDNARLLPVWVGGLTTGLVAAAISAPIAAGVFGGVTGGGTDALVALFRTLGLGVFQSAFAQGLTSDPLDKAMSYTVVFVILSALPLTVKSMFSRGETTVAD
jgi:hypothetical protein